MAKGKKKEKSAEAILFPEINVDGVKVRPWSLGVLAEVSPYISAIIETLEEKGINVEELTFSGILKVYFAIAPHAVAVISKTVGMDEEKVAKFDMPKSVKILRVIWEQNQDSLKNALTLFGVDLEMEGTEEREEETE